MYDMQRRSTIIRVSAIIGTHPDFMIRANYLTCEEDAANAFQWMINFTPFEGEAVKRYNDSKKLNIQDIFMAATIGTD